MDGGGAANPAKEVPPKGDGKPEKGAEESKEADGKSSTTAEQLSEADLELKERLETAVEGTKDSNMDLVLAALEILRSTIRESTSSMTSVPKPLKFLLPHYETLRETYAKLDTSEGRRVRPQFADVLSVLAMVVDQGSQRDCLEYKLAGDKSADIGQWGHEYLRSLTGEIGREYDARLQKEEEVDEPADLEDLLGLVRQIVPYLMSHNAEAEAIDLLMETQQLQLLQSLGHIDKDNHGRVCLYLLRCADFLGNTEDVNEALEIALSIYLSQKAFTDAARVALRLGNPGQVRRVLQACGDDDAVAVQVGMLLGRQGYLRVGYGASETAEDDGDEAGDSSATGIAAGGDDDDDDDDDLAMMAAATTAGGSAVAAGTGGGPAGSPTAGGPRSSDGFVLPGRVKLSDRVLEAIGNSKRSSYFRALARELDVVAPKHPDDVYKMHLVDGGSSAVRGMVGDDGPRLETARANLAASYVTALVNCGHGTDKVLTAAAAPGTGRSDGESGSFAWVYRNKEDGQTAAAAALGLIHLWDVDEVSTATTLMSSSSEHCVAGGVLAMALMCVGVATAEDIALELVSEHMDPDSTEAANTANVRAAGILGLGLAYAGSARNDVAAKLTPYIADRRDSWSQRGGSLVSVTATGFDLAALASLALGFVFVGTSDEVAASVIVDRIMEAGEAERASPLFRHLVLGLGLVFLGQSEAIGPMKEIVATIEGPLGRECALILSACAFAGTGNVDVVQQMLAACAEHPEMEAQAARDRARVKDDDDSAPAEDEAGAAASAPRATPGGDTPMSPSAAPPAGGGDASAAAAGGAAASGAGAGAAAPAASTSAAPVDERAFQYQTVAALGLGLVAMGEDLSIDMASRMIDHMLQYGDMAVRRAVPLTLALCHISDPEFSVVDALSKLTHDPDVVTSQSAIIALGLAAAGTNNSRVAGLLRALSQFYRKEADHLFLIRIAQGLVHAGKGLVTLSPLHSDRLLLRPAAIAGVLAVVVCSLDFSRTLLGRWHSLLFCLTPALLPRMVMTVDADSLDPVATEVRIGTGVETVGQAGRPKTITGFQTHRTPALMTVNDRAELADDSLEALCSVLEGVVLVRKKAETITAAEIAAAAADAASARPLGRVPSRMAGIMAQASGVADDND